MIKLDHDTITTTFIAITTNATNNTATNINNNNDMKICNNTDNYDNNNDWLHIFILITADNVPYKISACKIL